MPITLDEAIAVLVDALRGAAKPDERKRRDYGCDLWVFYAAQEHMRRQSPLEEMSESDLQPF